VADRARGKARLCPVPALIAGVALACTTLGVLVLSLAAAPAFAAGVPLGGLTALSHATVATPGSEPEGNGSEPVSLVVSPDGRSAYAGFERGNVIAQYRRDPTTGELKALSTATVTAGTEPRTIAISPDGTSVYAANFNGVGSGLGSISQFSRNPETGALTAVGSPVPTGGGGFPHGIAVSPDGTSVYVANFNGNGTGGNGSITELVRDPESGALTAAATIPTGPFPNGIAISADAKSVYTANRGSETVVANTVSQYSRNPETGELAGMGTIEAGEEPHDVAVSPDGRSVYVADAGKKNSQERTVGEYSRNTETGRLAVLKPKATVAAGEARGVAVSPDGASVYAANRAPEEVSQYGRSAETGNLAALTTPTAKSGSASYSVAISADGRSVYVTNEKSHSISQYKRATAPTVATEPASGVGSASATLNGMVNPEGAEVTACRLEYGPTNSYGSSAACAPSPGSGSNPVAVSASVSGLSPEMIYHFRVAVTSSRGPSAGKDVTLKTQASPPTLVAEPASGVGHNAATFNATVNPNGAQVSECKFEYGTTSSYGSSTNCTPSPGAVRTAVAVSASLTGLSAKTTFHYRVTATNVGGISVGPDQTLTTLSEPSPQVTTTVQQSPVNQAPPPPSQGVLPQKATAPPVPDVKLLSRSLWIGSSGLVNLKVTCPVGETSCTGTVIMRTLNAVNVDASGRPSGNKIAVLKLALGTFTVAGGQVKVVGLRLSAKARALLARMRMVKVRATIASYDPAGATHLTVSTITLRALTPHH
jgi:DNA-binding beta-propeller fold protein YncE